MLLEKDKQVQEIVCAILDKHIKYRRESLEVCIYLEEALWYVNSICKNSIMSILMAISEHCCN